MEINKKWFEEITELGPGETVPSEIPNAIQCNK
jgi:hypothetical protein